MTSFMIGAGFIIVAIVLLAISSSVSIWTLIVPTVDFSLIPSIAREGAAFLFIVLCISAFVHDMVGMKDNLRRLLEDW